MKAYIIKIVGAALVGTFAEYLVPREWKKYVKLVSGILMLSVLLIPFKIDTEKIFLEAPEAKEYLADGEALLMEKVRLQLESDVAEDIRKRVSEEFSKNVTAEVEIETTAEGKIKEVRSIILHGKEEADITERLKYVYGTEAVTWTNK